MDEFVLNSAINSMGGKARLDDADVKHLRQTVYAHGVLNREVAESLFALDRAVPEKSESWVDFFVEAITDYLVNVEAPMGYVSQINVDWLIRAISSNGVVDTQTEIELLMRIMEKANSMPASLSAFALRQVQHVVVSGEGPLAKGRKAKKGVVTGSDVKMLRRVLYAYSGDNALGISRDEAEVLFDINDATAKSKNDSGWSVLFSKAIAFSLMAASGHLPQPRDEALAREEWLADDGVDLGGFFANMFAGGLRGVRDSLAASDSVEKVYKDRNAAFENANASAEIIDSEEAQWLIDRIGRDGKLHENERALIAFLKAESPNLHPSLAPLLDKVA